MSSTTGIAAQVLPGAGERADVTRSIDLRSVPPRERRTLVFSVFDALPDGGVLHVVSDDELRPLRFEMERLRKARTAWFQSKPDGVHWESLIRRIPQCETGEGAAAVLERTWPFSKIQREAIAGFCVSARYLQFGRGHVFAEQGSLFPYVGVVASGLVQAGIIALDAKEIALHDRIPGDVFGENSLFGGVSAMRFVARTDDTVVVLLAAAGVRRACAHDAALARGFTLLIAESNRTLVERLASISAQPTVARLAAALLAYADMREGLNPAVGRLRDMRQGDLAAMAGTGRDLVYRAVAQLEADGAIGRSAGRIVSLNRRKLERFARMTKY